MATASKHNRQCGFTLLELLVVVVIVSILFTYTTLAIRSSSPEERIQEEAFRMQRLVQLALEESILRGEEYGIEIQLNGYRFLHLYRNRWQPLEQDKLLRARELPLDMELELELEKTAVTIEPAGKPMSEQMLNLDSDPDEDTEDRKKTRIKPQIYLLSSGEITPEFEIRIYILGIETSYFVKGLFDGTVTAEISDL